MGGLIPRFDVERLIRMRGSREERDGRTNRLGVRLAGRMKLRQPRNQEQQSKRRKASGEPGLTTTH